MPKLRLALCAPPEPRRRNGGLLLRVGRGEEGPTSKGGREERGTEREEKGIPQSQGEWNNLELWITEKGVADDVEVVTCVELGHVKLKAPRQTIDAVQHETEPVRRRTPQHTHTLAAR